MFDLKLIKKLVKSLEKIFSFNGTYYETLRLKTQLRNKSYKEMKKENIKPTDAELEILKVLWQKKEASVKEINEELNQYKPVGYTTTLKIMQIMHEKGMLSRIANGRSHIYKPEIEENETKSFIIKRMMNSLFGGSAKEMVMQALGNDKPSSSDLEEIKKLIEEMEKDK